MVEYNKLLKNLETLQMDKIREFYPKYIEMTKNNEKTLTEALYELTEKEIEYRDERASQIQIQVSAFPFKKTIDDYDFDFQPSINRKILDELNTLGFLERHENVLFVGSSGVGKTHLAISLGITAAKARNSVYFITCHDLITQLNKAFFENKLDSKIKHYSKFSYSRLISNIGYTVVDIVINIGSCSINSIGRKCHIRVKI